MYLMVVVPKPMVTRSLVGLEKAKKTERERLIREVRDARDT